MEVLQQNVKNIKIPTQLDKVYKDECVYSFDNPVCLRLNYKIKLVFL